MPTVVLSVVAGLMFGAGLILSGMANPAKILGFLDVAGAWDPSLAMVMVGAIGVAFIAFRNAAGRALALNRAAMQLPSARAIDRRLVLGSAVFGAGWGLVGFCPGPALVAIGLGATKAWLFVAAMLAGMAIFEIAERRGQRLRVPETERV